MFPTPEEPRAVSASTRLIKSKAKAQVIVNKVQESHCSPVHHLVFNYTDEGMQNLFATVGKEQVWLQSLILYQEHRVCILSELMFASAQATIYDDLHMGDFIAVVVNFTNQKTEYADGGVRLTCMHFAMPHHKVVLKHSSLCRSYIHAHG